MKIETLPQLERPVGIHGSEGRKEAGGLLCGVLRGIQTAIRLMS